MACWPGKFCRGKILCFHLHLEEACCVLVFSFAVYQGMNFLWKGIMWVLQVQWEMKTVTFLHCICCGQCPCLILSCFYQNQPEVNKFHSTNQRISGTMFTEILPTTSESSQVSGIKRSKDVASQSDFWGLSSESPLASTLTEDDFLDMVLGIYLSSSNQLFCFLSFFISRCCFVALENLLREFLQSYDLTKSANIRGFLSWKEVLYFTWS